MSQESHKFQVGDLITDQAFPGKTGHQVLNLRNDSQSGRAECQVDHGDGCVLWHLENNLRLWKPSDANPLPWEEGE